MNILTLITRNWFRGPQTQRFPERQAPAPQYRGKVVLDPALCRSCSKCAQVCVSAAITFGRVEGDQYAWAYDPARCTYCGVCVTYCPVAGCLTQVDDRSSSCLRPGEQAETVTVIKQRRKKAAAR